MKRFPEKLRFTREEAGLNQTELGRLIGVTQRSITDYETGRAIPHRKNLQKLAQALHVTVEYLTNDEVDDPQTGRVREDRLNAAYELFGSKGKKEMAELLERNTALLAGGDIDQASKDAFFEAIMTAYITCKNEARARYGSAEKAASDDE